MSDTPVDTTIPAEVVETPENLDEGLPVEVVEPPPTEEELEEIEREGQKYKIPKALKNEFLMHKDYTQKTQSLAEEKKGA